MNYEDNEVALLTAQLDRLIKLECAPPQPCLPPESRASQMVS